jgi:hypothetical protein
MISRRQVADLNDNMKSFQRVNAQLVVIGNGPAKFIMPFRKDTRYQGPLFTDPTLETYHILGFNKGITSLMGLDPLKAGIRALTTGYLQKGVQGPPTQQGGVLVVGPGDFVHYIYRSKKAGDHPSLTEVLHACEDNPPM